MEGIPNSFQQDTLGWTLGRSDLGQGQRLHNHWGTCMGVSFCYLEFTPSTQRAELAHHSLGQCPPTQERQWGRGIGDDTGAEPETQGQLAPRSYVYWARHQPCIRTPRLSGLILTIAPWGWPREQELRWAQQCLQVTQRDERAEP